MTTIQLTTEPSFRYSKGEYRNKIYFLTSINQAEKDLLFEAKESNNLKHATGVLGIDCENITKFGTVKEARGASIYNELGFLLGPIISDDTKCDSNRPKHYRLYSKTVEEQERTKHIINLCSNIEPSAASAYRQLREKYCLVWYKESDVYVSE